MAKKAITFVTAWSRYNAGETAAFDPDQADDLIAKKKAVLAKDQPKSVVKEVSISLNVRDNPEVNAVMAQIEAQASGLAQLSEDLDARQADLDARAASLDAMAADLAAREAALSEREARRVVEKGDDASGTDAGAAPEDTQEAPAKAPALPKQGR